jgi:nucleoside-diphosphate-sugar epimerase
MKVLVTGASGFLGSHVAEQLASQGHDVRVLVRKTSNRKFLSTLPRIEFVEGSIEQADRVREAVAGVDAVVHSAALVKARTEDEFITTNVEGTRNVLSAIQEVAPGLARLVHVSSLEAAGPSPDGKPVPLTQERPITRYGRSKLASEALVREAKGKVRSVILRPGGIYGPRDQEMAEAFRSVKRGVLPITGDGSTKYSVVYGPDCATACVRAITADVPSAATYFVSDGEVYSQRSMMELIEEAWGTRAFVRVGLPNSVMKGVSHLVGAYGKLRNQAVMLTPEKADMLLRHWVCGADTIKSDLGWEPELGFAEGARRTANWYREHQWM